MDPYEPYVPPEILSQIFSYIDPKDKATFRAIVLSSKLFYHVAIGILYEKAEFTLDSSIENKDLRIRSLSSTALKNKTLAHRVKHLSMRSNPTKMVERESLLHCPWPPEHISNVDYRKQTSDATNDHTLSMLLPMLTNLRNLDLEFTCGMPQLTNDSLRHHSALKFLESLVLTYSNSTTLAGGHYGPLMIGLLQLPSLKYVYLRRVCDVLDDNDTEFTKDERDRWSVTNIPPKSLNLTHLELRDCEFSSWTCSRLLETCAGLKTFIHDNIRSNEDVGAIYDSLKEQKSCLEYLWLDGCVQAQRWMSKTTATLKDFSRLKRLRLPFRLIMDSVEPATYFPRSLEVVHLIGTQYCPVEVPRVLMAMLRDTEAAALPLIKQIDIEYGVPLTLKNPEFIKLIGGNQDIQTVALMLGVHISVTASFKPNCAKIGERKWGMDEDIEWAVCSDGRFSLWPSRGYELKELARLHAEGKKDIQFY